ncbi:MAG: nitrile hydratase accessory protein [Solirubrobacterales bacterium]|nr:nitrile hydratase accessory protein [Solirubrobacterales bacterium]
MRQLPQSEAIPRRDGELSFREPWEVRTLGLVVQLHQDGHFDWPEFQSTLIETIAEWEAMPEPERRPWSYYACWQQAAERLLTRKHMLSTDEFDERAYEFRSGRRTPPHTHGGGLLSRDAGAGGPMGEPPSFEHVHARHSGDHQ